MPKLSRRAMFPLFAAGGIAATDGSQGATLEQGRPGIVVRLCKTHEGWTVLVPDFASMTWWFPGMVVPTIWMPIGEYLKLLDDTYSMEA